MSYNINMERMKMLWLQSSEKFEELAEFNHKTGDYRVWFRSAPEFEAPEATEGFFAFLSSTFVALYRVGGELFLWVGSEVVHMADDVYVSVGGRAENRVLSVQKGGQKIISFKYSLDLSDRISEDPTPFIDDEDFDFGLFVANISQSEERKKILRGEEA